VSRPRHAGVHGHEVGDGNDAEPLQLVDGAPADAPDLGHRQPGVVAGAHLRVRQVAQPLQVGLGFGKGISRLCDNFRRPPSNARWHLCNTQDIGTQLFATLVQTAWKSCQIKKCLVYRVWLGTRHALGNNLKDAPRYVTIQRKIT